MVPPVCKNKECMCYKMEFYEMFKVLKCRRMELHKNLKQQNTSVSNKKLSFNMKKRLKNLDVKSNNYGFVCLNGAIWKPSKITDLMRDFIKLNKLNPLNYAPY